MGPFYDAPLTEEITKGSERENIMLEVTQPVKARSLDSQPRALNCSFVFWTWEEKKLG